MSDTKPKPRQNGEYLSTLARGLSVLRSFTKERPEMTLSEVAAATDLSPAVARRCLNTLVELGYVGREGKLFLLTPEVMSFASAFIESMKAEALQHHFGHHHQAGVYQARLKEQTWEESETLSQMAQDVEALVMRLYPTAPEEIAVVLGHEDFIDALRDQQLQIYIKQA